MYQFKMNLNKKMASKCQNERTAEGCDLSGNERTFCNPLRSELSERTAEGTADLSVMPFLVSKPQQGSCWNKAS